MGFSLGKFKKSLLDEIKSGGNLAFKAGSKTFDAFDDIIDAPYVKPALKTAGLGTLSPVLGTGYAAYKGLTSSLSKRMYSDYIEPALNIGSDLGTGAFTSRFADPYKDDQGNLKAKFSGSSFRQGATSIFGNAREWKEAQGGGGGLGNAFRNVRNQGREQYWDSNLPMGAKVAGSLALDPTMYVPTGAIGRGSTALGLSGTKFGKLALGSEKVGATSRTARVAGGLLEGMGKYTLPAAAAAGVSSEITSRTPWKGDDILGGFAAPVIGSSIAKKFEPMTTKQNVIKDQHGDVFRDLGTYIDTKEFPDKLHVNKWRSMLQGKGVTSRELEFNGVADLLRERKGDVTKAEILDTIEKNNFDIEETISEPGKTLSVYPDGANYTVPGGDPGTYREIAIKQKASRPDGVDPMAWEDSSPTLLETADGIWEIEKMSQGWFLKKEGETLDVFNTKEDAIDYAATLKSTLTSNNQFKNQDDLLMHIRVDDRNGGRQLFVHELQSDWAQETRSGKSTHVTHNNPPLVKKNPVTRDDIVVTQDGDGNYVINLKLDDGTLDKRGIPNADYPSEEVIKDFITIINMGNPDGLPGRHPHPFQDNWQVVGVKRILRYAAANGYDEVKFASGEETLKVMPLPRLGKDEAGRLNSYNKTIPDIVNGLAKRLGFEVTKEETGSKIEYPSSDLTWDEIEDSMKRARLSNDVPSLETQDAIEDLTYSMRYQGLTLSLWAEYRSDFPDGKNQVKAALDFLGLKIQEVPSTPNTVVKMTPESRRNITSKPQTMFGAISEDDARRFDEKMRELRQKSMSADPNEAAAAEAEMARLGEQRSQMDSEPQKQISRSAKLDELSDEDIFAQLKSTKKLLNEMAQKRMRGSVRPTPEETRQFEQLSDVMNKQAAEALNRGMLSVIHDSNGDTRLTWGERPDQNLVYIRFTSEVLREISESLDPKILGKAVPDVYSALRNGVPFGIKPDSYSKIAKIFMIKDYDSYTKGVEDRRKAEGGRGFFGSFLDEAEKRLKGGGQDSLSFGVKAKDSGNGDPNAAKRAARQAKYKNLPKGTTIDAEGNVRPPLDAMPMDQFEQAKANRTFVSNTRPQQNVEGRIPNPQRPGDINSIPQAPSGMPVEGYAGQRPNDLRIQDQRTAQNTSMRGMENTIQREIIKDQDASVAGAPPIETPGRPFTNYDPNVEQFPANPMPNVNVTRTGDSNIGEPFWGTRTDVSAGDPRPTLRDQLNSIVWGKPEVQDMSDTKLRKNEKLRLKTETSEFAPPTAKPMGDYRLRAEELLKSLSEEELNKPVADLEAAELISSMVGQRDIERALDAKELAAHQYREATNQQQAVNPMQAQGAQSGGLPVANTARPRLNIEEVSEPEAEQLIKNAVQEPMNPKGPPKPSLLLPEDMRKSTKFLTSLRPLAAIAEEVKVAKNKVHEAIIAASGINPSLAMKSPIGRLIVAKIRQDGAIEQHAEMAAGVLDRYARRGGMGNMMHALNIDDNGIMREAGVHWNDVISDIDAYKAKLSPNTLRFAQDFRDILDDLRIISVAHGVPVLPRDINGKFWVPRVTKGVKDIEIDRPTNHALDRIWEDATAGVKNGVNYADPRETIKLYTYDVYRQIVKRQFADEMEKLSMPLQGAIKQEIYDKYSNALVAKEEQSAKVKAAAEALAKDKTNADLRKILKDEREAMKPIRKEWKDARFAVDEALKDVRKQESNKSLAYDANGNRIPVAPVTIARLGERLVGRDDAKLIRDWIGLAGMVPKREESHILARAAGTFGRTLRTTTASFDFATPFIHNLPLLANNPVAWAKSVGGQFRSFADPKFVSEYQVENRDVINEMRNYGIDVTSNEYYEAITQGDIPRLWNKTTGKVGLVNTVGNVAAKQTLGRMQSAMDANLMIARVELWKANKDRFLKDKGVLRTGLAQGSAAPDALAGLAQYVRNMSGALDSRDLLVGKSQRDLESLWLAFSPKLFRSTIALVGMAMKPTTIEGRAAMRSLAVMSAAAAGAFYGLNLAFGNSNEEALDSINPAKTRQFMSVKLGDGYYGIGGQVRAVAQLLGQSEQAMQTGDWSTFSSTDVADNPLLRFYVGRSAPALSITQNTVEGVSGGKINANPYEEVNGVMSFSDFEHSLVGTTARSFLPFLAQNKLEGEGANQLAFESFGGRYTKFSRAEERDMRIQSMGFKTIDGEPVVKVTDLNREQKDAFYAKYPVEQITGTDNITKMFSQIDEEEKLFQTDLLKMSTYVENGKMSKEQFRGWYNNRNSEKYDRIDQIKKDASIQPAGRAGFTGSVTDYLASKNTRPEDRAVDEYYKVSSNTPLTEQGTVDFDAIARKRQQLLSSLPPEQAAYVRRMTTREAQTSDNKLVTEYDIVKDITKPYFEVEDEIFKVFRERSGFMQQFATKDSYDKWIQQTSQESGLTPSTFEAYIAKKIPDVKAFQKVSTDYKKYMRLMNPELDRALTEWYGMEPANRIDYLLSGYGSDAGVAFAAQYAQGGGPNRTETAEFALSLPKSGLKTKPRTFRRPRPDLDF